MCFFPAEGKDRVKITRADYNLLDEYEMVNDTVIDFYLKWIEKTWLAPEAHRKLSSEFPEQFLFFSTFFYKKLLNMDNKKAKAELHQPLQQVTVYG